MRRIKSFLIIICMLSIYAASFYGCGKKEWSDSHNNEAGLPEIVIGSDNYPPYNYVDTDGNATGIDVELATEAFKRMGYKARFIYIDWEDKKNLLADRTIDCAWGSFSMNGRENEYRWAGPYMTSRQVVAVNMESDIYSLEDLEGKTIAVQTTTRPEKIFLSTTDERMIEDVPKQAEPSVALRHLQSLCNYTGCTCFSALDSALLMPYSASLRFLKKSNATFGNCA